jgi:alpha-tubulin suppressor-like RCC1 family protein
MSVLFAPCRACGRSPRVLLPASRQLECVLLQVARLAGKGTAAVACGHSYTAAVLMDGTLHTWGTGLGGQLGLGPNVMTAVWPTRILTGLEGVRWV